MAEPLKNLAWDDFRLVKAIAEARRAAGRGRALGVNHSTVFRRLGQIEEALGSTLFERHRTGYALTPAGEEMVSLAQRLDERHHRLHPQDCRPGGLARGRAAGHHQRLACSSTCSRPCSRAFRDQCRDVRLDIVLANQALNLSKRDADVAIRAMDNPPENLVGRRVARIAWALYGRDVRIPDPESVGSRHVSTERRWVSLGDNLATLKAVQFVQRARLAGADRLQGQHGARPGGGRRGRHRHRPPALLHWRRAAGLVRLSASRAGLSRRISGSSPTPTCATRRASASSSTSWPRRSPSGASSLRAQRRTRPLEKRKLQSSLLLC